MRLVSCHARAAGVAATLAICACAQPSKPSLTLHDVPSDGNCLFSAVALSAALVDQDATQARARAVRNAATRLRADTMGTLQKHAISERFFSELVAPSQTYFVLLARRIRSSRSAGCP